MSGTIVAIDRINVIEEKIDRIEHMIKELKRQSHFTVPIEKKRGIEGLEKDWV